MIIENDRLTSNIGFGTLDFSSVLRGPEFYWFMRSLKKDAVAWAKEHRKPLEWVQRGGNRFNQFYVIAHVTPDRQLSLVMEDGTTSIVPFDLERWKVLKGNNGNGTNP